MSYVGPVSELRVGAGAQLTAAAVRSSDVPSDKATLSPRCSRRPDIPERWASGSGHVQRPYFYALALRRQIVRKNKQWSCKSAREPLCPKVTRRIICSARRG
ncbi:hypothetical protein BD626DRAFT_491521 [Schizophyllum amplum]|uniref:Uncharacterized protein n=1 Tax=Schizophyllum amplum TaxID=97359 RepID=A0A550CHZ5_9AGAR|nr:hypothetical protein BD626DRAFT_491521 [Auriculariopsis ampla]